MYKQAASTLVILILSTGMAWADSHGRMEDQFFAECERYAKEDNIAPEDLEAYIEQCVKDLAPPSEGSEAGMESREPAKE